MARPVTIEDLDSRAIRGDEIARWSSYLIMEYPHVAENLVKAAIVAKAMGLAVDKEGIFEKLTPKQLEEKLQQAQDRWDELEVKYNAAVEFGASKIELWAVNDWARTEGLPQVKVAE